MKESASSSPSSRQTRSRNGRDSKPDESAEELAFKRFREQVYDAVAAELDEDSEKGNNQKLRESQIEEEIQSKWGELEQSEKFEYLNDDEKPDDDGEEEDEDEDGDVRTSTRKKATKSKAWQQKLERQRQDREARYAELDKQIQQLRKQQAENQRRRIEHLLGQSEVFQKFIDTSKSHNALSSSKSQGVKKTSSTKEAPMSPGGSKRRESVEQDDDDDFNLNVDESDSVADAETSSASSATQSHSKGGSGRKPGAKKGRKKKEDSDDAVMNTAVRLSRQPSSVQGDMRDYQLEGLNWMIQLQENGINGILADEMGLGKTLQTIALLAYNMEYHNVRGPHLILVPKSTLSNWMNEFHMWCPSLRVLCFHGTKEERKDIIKEKLAPGQKDPDWDVVVTTYEMAIIESSTFRRWPWQYLIIDEAHRIKNENSALASTVRTYAVAHRLLLTGTPLQNNLHELWALLNFLLPDIFGDSVVFDDWFDMAKDDSSAKSQMIDQLHRLLRPFMLRRLKSDVAKNLPPKKELFLYVGLNDLQKEVYRSILKKDVNSVLYPGSGGQNSKARLLNIVMQLRKVCAHPYLFPGVEDRSLDPLGEHVITASSKLSLLDKLLKKLRQRGSRVLIFSQMTRLLDILEDYCHIKSYEYCRIDGQTSYEEREDAINAFNRPDSKKFVFLLSTRAGGLGINLATADTVILFDSDWNPQVDLQAQDRAHRIGQKKPVTVFRLITQDTIEEKIVERAMVKLKLDAVVVQQGSLANKNNRLSKDEMLSMIQYGADSIFRKDADKSETEDTSTEYSEADIDRILAEGEQKTQEVQKKAEAMGKAKAKEIGMDASEADSSLLDFKMGANTDSHVFEGIDYRKERTQQEVDAARFQQLKAEQEEEYAMSKRERKRVKSYNENVLFGGEPKSRNAVNWSNLAAARRRTAQVLPKTHRLPKLESFQFLDAFRLVEIAREQVKYVESNKHELKNNSEDVSALLDRDLPHLSEEQDRLLAEGFPSWKKKDFRTFVEACCTHGRNAVSDIVREVASNTEHSEAEVQRYFNCFWFGVNRSTPLASREIASLLKESDDDYKSTNEWPIGYGRQLEKFPQILNAVRRAETRGRDIRRMHGAVSCRIAKTQSPLPHNALIEHQCVSPKLCESIRSFTESLEQNRVSNFALDLERSLDTKKNKKGDNETSTVGKEHFTPSNRPPWHNSTLKLRPNPWECLYWRYEGRKSNIYTAEQDRYLLSLVVKFGHGHWRKFKRAILADPQWKFDSFFRSRSTQELARRTEVVMRCIERDTKDIMDSSKDEMSNRKKAIDSFFSVLAQENKWMEKESQLKKKWDKLIEEGYRVCPDMEGTIEMKSKGTTSSKTKVGRDRMQELKEQADKKTSQLKQLIEKCPEKGFSPAFLPQLARFVEGLKKSNSSELRCNKNLIAEEFISGAQKRSESARQKANKGGASREEGDEQPVGGPEKEDNATFSSKGDSLKKAPSDNLTIPSVAYVVKLIARLSDEKPSSGSSANGSTSSAEQQQQGTRVYVLKKDYQWLLGATRKHVQEAKNAINKENGAAAQKSKSKEGRDVINMRGSVNPLDKLSDDDKRTLVEIINSAGEANKEDLVSRFIQRREGQDGFSKLTRNLVNCSLSVIATREGRIWRMKSPQEQEEYIQSLYQRRREKSEEKSHQKQSTLDGSGKRPRENAEGNTAGSESEGASGNVHPKDTMFRLTKTDSEEAKPPEKRQRTLAESLSGSQPQPATSVDQTHFNVTNDNIPQ